MIVCTIHGPPGPAKANTRTTPVRRRKFVSMITTTPYRKWQAHATAEIAKAAKGVKLSGALWITVSAYWPKTNRIGPAAGLALGDVDAVIKAVMDAIEHSGAVGNDSQFTTAILHKYVDRKFPRIEVRFGENPIDGC